MNKQKVAILGAQSSFHHIAALHFFGDALEPVFVSDFRSMFDNLNKKNADFAIMAIENSIAGTILPNYALLRDSGKTVFGEIVIPVHLHLLALNKIELSSITKVYSHPMAILESRPFFKKYRQIQMIEMSDTAAAASLVAKERIENAGVIAGRVAANRFNLEIIAENIESHPRNFTRFLIISDKTEIPSEPDEPGKASICFVVSHKSGSLASILSCFSECDLNLTKIQSLPLIYREWEYYFHVDLEYEEYHQLTKALKMIEPMTTERRIIGVYKKGNTIQIE